jgi:hypothetical protein
VGGLGACVPSAAAVSGLVLTRVLLGWSQTGSWLRRPSAVSWLRAPRRRARRVVCAACAHVRGDAQGLRAFVLRTVPGRQTRAGALSQYMCVCKAWRMQVATAREADTSWRVETARRPTQCRGRATAGPA